jgi:hypothetical protein
MFNSDNFAAAGVEYYYDILNLILCAKLDGSTEPDDIQNISDSINNQLYVVGNKIMHNTIQVGATKEGGIS